VPVGAVALRGVVLRALAAWRCAVRVLAWWCSVVRSPALLLFLSRSAAVVSAF